MRDLNPSVNTLFKVSLLLLALSIHNAKAETAMDGLYGQIGIGLSRPSLTIESTALSLPSTAYAITPWISNNTSLSGVLSLGYQRSLTNLFSLGINLDIHPLAQSSRSYGLNINTPSPLTLTGAYKSLNANSLSLTPGLLLSPNSMAYVKWGYQWGSVEKNYTINSSPFATTTQDINNYGTILGVGYKKILANSWYGFTEFTTTILNNVSNTNSIPVSVNGHNLIATYTAISGGAYYNFTLGLGYKF